MCRRWPTSNTLGNISASRAFGWVLFDGVAVSAIDLVVYDVNHARSTIQLNILGNMNKVVVAGEVCPSLNSARRPNLSAMSNNERVRVRVWLSHFSADNAFLLTTGVQGVTVHRPIIYGNTATVLTPEEKELLTFPDHTHRWTVAVRSAASATDSDIVGGADDLGYFIKRVAFKLHDTYPNPTRSGSWSWRNSLVLLT